MDFVWRRRAMRNDRNEADGNERNRSDAENSFHDLSVATEGPSLPRKHRAPASSIQLDDPQVRARVAVPGISDLIVPTRGENIKASIKRNVAERLRPVIFRIPYRTIVREPPDRGRNPVGLYA